MKKNNLKNSILPKTGPWGPIFFFICFGYIAYQTFLLTRPFLPGFLGAAMLGLIFSPLYERVLLKVKNPNTAAALLMTGIILVTVIPAVWIGWMAVNEAANLRPALSGFIDNYQTPAYLQRLFSPVLNYFESYHIELKPLVLDKAEAIGAQMGPIAGKFAGHLLIMFFNALILILMLFFVFRDGKKAAENVLSALPISASNKEALLESVYRTFLAVISGVFATAAIGGLSDMLGFFLAGVPLPVFFGLATAFFFLFGLSFLVTIPLAFWVMNHDVGMGIFLLIWGILVAVIGDNILKPALMGSKARMPFLLMLFSTLGGIKIYGIMGLFLGPVVVTAFATFWTIYRKDYKV